MSKQRLIDAERLKRHYSWWTGPMELTREELDTIVDMQPDAAPAWIPVSEQLPNNDDEVVNRMPDVLRPNKTTVRRRQNIIVKISWLISEEDARNIKRNILEQFEDHGVAVISGDVDIITVDADVLAVE